MVWIDRWSSIRVGGFKQSATVHTHISYCPIAWWSLELPLHLQRTWSLSVFKVRSAQGIKPRTINSCINTLNRSWSLSVRHPPCCGSFLISPPPPPPMCIALFWLSLGVILSVVPAPEVAMKVEVVIGSGARGWLITMELCGFTGGSVWRIKDRKLYIIYAMYKCQTLYLLLSS